MRPKDEIPYLYKKWITTGDIKAAYPQISYKTMKRLARNGTWDTRKKPYRSANPDKAPMICINRDDFDEWILENGLPVLFNGNKIIYKKVDVIFREKRRLNWEEDRLRNSEPPPIVMPVQPSEEQWIKSPDGSLNMSQRSHVRHSVNANRRIRVQPAKLIRWDVIRDLVEIIVKAGGPSGDGADMDELRRLLSLWIIETQEPCADEIWDEKARRREAS